MSERETEREDRDRVREKKRERERERQSRRRKERVCTYKSIFIQIIGRGGVQELSYFSFSDQNDEC